MGSFFQSPHVVPHEVGHALVGHQIGVGVQGVEIHTLGDGGRTHYALTISPLIGRLTSMAGPLNQLIHFHDSPGSRWMKGRLFDPARAKDICHWAQLRDTLQYGARGWQKDLQWIYQEICDCWRPDTAEALIGPIAHAEIRVRDFLLHEATQAVTNELTPPLTRQRRFSGEEFAALMEGKILPPLSLTAQEKSDLERASADKRSAS